MKKYMDQNSKMSIPRGVKMTRKDRSLEEINKAISQCLQDLKDLEAARSALGFENKKYYSNHWKKDPDYLIDEQYEIEYLSDVYKEYEETGDKDHIIQAVEFILESHRNR